MHNVVAEFCRQNGLPEGLAESWRRRGIEAWTALQEVAWAQGLHRSDEHWLVGGPTSAGKSLVAEVVAARHLLGGEKVLWLVPTRALAEAVARQCRATFAPLGLRVLCATSDHAGQEGRLARGQFDLLVAVYEKAAQWLLRQPHGLAEVGLVVADELTMLRDPERGARLDTLLTLIKSSPYAPRRLGLCLAGLNWDELANWWGGRLLVCRERPRPLREGVLELSSGRFRWRSLRPDEVDEDRLAEPAELRQWLRRALDGGLEDGWDSDQPPLMAATAAVAAGLAVRGEPTLLFAPSRSLARRWAEALGRVFALPTVSPATLKEARRLAECEPGHDHALLTRTLARGVGFHHADLSPAARGLVEAAFASGELALLLATPTLAQGMNLAALNVVHWPERPEAVGTEGRWRQVPLERWRFIDQGGRAARLGFGAAQGRSILVAWDAPHAARLRQYYLLDDPEPLSSGLASADLAPSVLLALAGDVARTPENLRELLAATFAGRTAWREAPRELDQALTQAISACRQEGLVKSVAPTDGLRLTGLGQVCASQGLPPAVLCRLRPWLEEDLGLTDEEPLPAIWALALCAPAGLLPPEANPAGPLLANFAREWFAAHERPLPAPFAALLDRPGGPTAAELGALAAGWRLARWVSAEPTGQVEAQTGWTAGALARVGEGLSWLAQGAAALLPLLGGAGEAAEGWRELATRLAAGVTAAGVALARLPLPELGRTPIQNLCVAGLSSSQDVAEASLDFLAGLLHDEDLARRVQAAARQMLAKSQGPGRGLKLHEILALLHGGAAMGKVVRAGVGESSLLKMKGGLGSPRPDMDWLLEIDLQSPGVIRAGGRELRLPPLSYDLLATLAERPGKVLTRAALYQRLWPEGGVEDQQLDAHRRRLDQALRQAFGPQGGEMIEAVRGVGFRLNLPAPRVHLRRG